MLASLSPCSMKISVQQIRKKHIYSKSTATTATQCLKVYNEYFICILCSCLLPFAILPFFHLAICCLCLLSPYLWVLAFLLLLLLALNLQLFAATAAQVQHIFVIINFKLASVNLNRTRHPYSPHLSHPKTSSSSLLYCYLETWQALNTLTQVVMRLFKLRLEEKQL